MAYTLGPNGGRIYQQWTELAKRFDQSYVGWHFGRYFLPRKLKEQKKHD